MASWQIATTRPALNRRTRSRAMSLALVLMVVSVFINYVDRGNLSIAAPLLKTELSLSVSQLGILFSAFFWTYTAMLFVCGWFVDRFDATRVLMLGFLVWSLATAATGIVHGFAMLLIMRLFLGIGESVAFPCYSKIMAQHVAEHDRGLANGAIVAGVKLGPAAGTLGAGLLIASYGWRPVFVGIGLISLLWLPAWRKWQPRAETFHRNVEVSPSIREILRQRSFWTTTGGLFCLIYPLYFLVTWLPYYLVHEHHLSIHEMVDTAALYYSVDAAAALTTGWVTDILIRRGRPSGTVRKLAMGLGAAVAALGFLGCAWASSHTYLFWLMITGIGSGAGNACVWTFSQTYAGASAAGRWVGLHNGFGNLAGVIGPALTGFIVDWTGHFQMAIVITSGFCVLGALIWIFVVGEVKPVIWARDEVSEVVQRSAASGRAQRAV